MGNKFRKDKVPNFVPSFRFIFPRYSDGKIPPFHTHEVFKFTGSYYAVHISGLVNVVVKILP